MIRRQTQLVTRETDPVERVLDGHVANAARLVADLEPDERGELDRLLRKLLISLGDTGGA